MSNPQSASFSSPVPSASRATDFRIEEYATPAPGPGEVLLRTIWLSLDPYMRWRMSDVRRPMLSQCRSAA